MVSLPQGIIDFATAPPIGVLNDHLDSAGPYGAGQHTLTTWINGGVLSTVSDTYGVRLNFNGAIPPYLGRTLGYDDGGLIVMDEYQNRLVQLVVQHQFLSGVWTVTQLEDIFTMPLTFRWSEALPGRIGLYVAPSIAVDLFYLLVT